MSAVGDGGDKADAGLDNYQERVTRNEGRLVALESLVRETREADRKLIEQRSDSLARELERRAESLLELVTARADAVLALGNEERRADANAVEVWKVEHEKLMNSMREGTRREGEIALGLLREVYDTAIANLRHHVDNGLDQNHEQSRVAIHELELRRQAATEKVEQMVRQWRDSDSEARALFTKQLDHHLDQLNHNNERMREFQANSVTRELWQSEKDATAARESLLRDQIIVIDRALLTMTPIATADKNHAEIIARMDASIRASAEVLDNKIGVVSEKVSDLKTYTDTTTGRSSGFQSVYAWGIAAVTVLISVILLANSLLSK